MIVTWEITNWFESQEGIIIKYLKLMSCKQILGLTAFQESYSGRSLFRCIFSLCFYLWICNIFKVTA